VTGDFPPSSGTIRFFGEDITHFPPYERIRRGLRRTYQISALFPGLTVRDNVIRLPRRFARTISPLRPGANDALMHATEALIQAVHLTPVRDQLVAELAHGQQRQLETRAPPAPRASSCSTNRPQGFPHRAARTDRNPDVVAPISVTSSSSTTWMSLRVVESVTMMHNGRVFARACRTRSKPTPRSRTLSGAGHE
jgi:branched-chain amino acid transport system ATP-binding protein